MRSSLRDLGLAVAMLGCAALGSGSATATPTLVGTTTNPTGINGLVVDGTIYDVTFSTTTLNSFTAGTTLSIDASTALAGALNLLSVTELNNVGASFLILNVDNSQNNYDAALICHNQCGVNPQWVGVSGEVAPLGSSGFTPFDAYVEAADFTEVGTVGAPEPLTLSIFGAGLVSAAAMRRRKKKKLDHAFAKHSPITQSFSLGIHNCFHRSGLGPCTAPNQRAGADERTGVRRWSGRCSDSCSS